MNGEVIWQASDSLLTKELHEMGLNQTWTLWESLALPRETCSRTRDPPWETSDEALQVFSQDEQLFASQSGKRVLIFNLGSIQCDQIGRFFNFGQLFKAFGKNYFPQISHILRQFFCKGVRIYRFSSEIIFGQLLSTFGNFFLVTLVVSQYSISQSVITDLILFGRNLEGHEQTNRPKSKTSTECCHACAA